MRGPRHPSRWRAAAAAPPPPRRDRNPNATAHNPYIQSPIFPPQPPSQRRPPQLLAAAGESVSQSARVPLKADSFRSLGLQLQLHEVHSLYPLMAIESKVNAFINCFVGVRMITSLHDLDIAICKNQGVDRFEELGLGPLLRNPLVVHYFSVPSDATEIFKITSEDIISSLIDYMHICPGSEIQIEDFLNFLVKQKSVAVRERLGIRIKSLGMHITFIREAKKAEKITLRRHLRAFKHTSDSIVSEKQVAEKITLRRHLRAFKHSSDGIFSEKRVLDRHFDAVSKHVKSFSFVHEGKHIRFESSSSEDDNEHDADNREDGSNDTDSKGPFGKHRRRGNAPWNLFSTQDSGKSKSLLGADSASLVSGTRFSGDESSTCTKQETKAPEITVPCLLKVSAATAAGQTAPKSWLLNSSQNKNNDQRLSSCPYPSGSEEMLPFFSNGNLNLRKACEEMFRLGTKFEMDGQAANSAGLVRGACFSGDESSTCTKQETKAPETTAPCLLKVPRAAAAGQTAPKGWLLNSSQNKNNDQHLISCPYPSGSEVMLPFFSNGNLNLRKSCEEMFRLGTKFKMDGQAADSAGLVRGACFSGDQSSTCTKQETKVPEITAPCLLKVSMAAAAGQTAPKGWLLNSSQNKNNDQCLSRCPYPSGSEVMLPFFSNGNLNLRKACEEMFRLGTKFEMDSQASPARLKENGGKKSSEKKRNVECQDSNSSINNLQKIDKEKGSFQFHRTFVRNPSLLQNPEKNLHSNEVSKDISQPVNPSLFQKPEKNLHSIEVSKDKSQPGDTGNDDQEDSYDLKLTSDDIGKFITMWKETCREHTVGEVFDKMLTFYKLTRGSWMYKLIFSSYPGIGLLNIAVTAIKRGIWDSLYDTFQDTGEIGSDDPSSKPYMEIMDVGPSSKRGITVDDIIKKIAIYFEVNNVTPRVGKLHLKDQISSFRKFRDCEEWLTQQFSAKVFGSLGYRDFIAFLEKHASLLCYEFHEGVTGDLEASLVQCQLLELLSQALSAFGKSVVTNKQQISAIIRKQFPLISFQLRGSDPDQDFLDLISRQKSSDVSRCVTFSVTLLGTRYNGDLIVQNARHSSEVSEINAELGQTSGCLGSVSDKDAIECLRKAPMLTDLRSWSHWDIIFAPSLGPLVEWLLNGFHGKELSCIVTSDGKLIRIEPSATVDEFLEAALQGSSFLTALKLLSLLSLYGGMSNVPLSLLKCYARLAFEVIIKNSMTSGVKINGDPSMHGKELSGPMKDRDLIVTHILLAPWILLL